MAKSSQFSKSLILVFFFLLGCAQGNDFPSIDETGNESASLVNPVPEPTPKDDSSASNEPPETAGTPGEDIASVSVQRLLLNQAMSLRYEKAGILENKVELPAGAQIEIPSDYEIKHLDFRNSSGSVERSSTGFIYPVKLISVPDQFESQFTQEKIDSINSTSGGLFIFASIVGSLEGTEGNFAVVTGAVAGSGFSKYYSTNGKPKFKFTSSVTKRFGDRLNKGIDPDSLSSEKRTKYQRIFEELKKAANRTIATPKKYLMMDKATAVQKSIAFEKTGVVSPSGAWSIATQATAVRHGFSNVPCAEFQSEVLRQAYQRAGYRVTDDFNKSKGNQLIWSNTAAVVNFSKALYTAGFVPWDSTKYRPITGAFMMNGAGLTPGHTYISGGDDGMIIVDNGAPQGRDLRKTTEKTISIMFQVGVFFLPPGINPPVW